MDDTDRRILEAASRVHGQRGARGATTKVIAQEAGVNEITLFRRFESKQALLLAAAQYRASESIRQMQAHPLPEVPRDIAAELAPYLAGSLMGILATQEATRTSLAEYGRQPEIDAEHMRDANYAWDEVHRYMTAAREAGLLRPDVDVTIATSLCVSITFADGMLRDLMPGRFPLAAEASVRAYLDTLLHGFAAREAAPGRNA